MSNKRFWVAFAVFQTIGFLAFYTANFYGDVALFFVGWLLSLPASGLLMFGPAMPAWMAICTSVALNFGAWFAIDRWGGKELPG